MNLILRDYREQRDWARPWMDRPGLICCCATADTPMYVLGGFDSGVSTFYAVADKVMMTAETSSAVTTANLSQARGAGGSVANPAVAGYFMGGNTTSTATVVTGDKLTFSNDTTVAKTTANLSQARSQLYGLSERSTKGYVAGGFTTATPVVAVATADKITFSTDTTAAQASANLSAARKAAAGMSEGTTKGYWAGGYTASIITTIVVTADKIIFSTDTTSAQASANLSQARAEVFAGSDGSTKGYWGGGQAGSVVNKVDKITFSTDTTAALTSASFNQYFGASGSNGTKMLGVAGVNGATGLVFAGSNKMTFATDVGAGAGVSVSQARQGAMGLSYQAL